MNDALTPLSERIDLWADVASAAIWRACWQGAIAVALVWVVCLAWRRLSPRWQCWLWRLAVVKFALALVWVTPLELPVLPPPAPVEYVTTAAPITLAPPVMPALEQPSPILETIVVAASPVEPIAWRPRGVVIALGVWCLGVATCAVRLARQWWLARCLRVGAGLVADVELIRILDEQRARLGLRRMPRLLVTTTSVGPALVGSVRPAIVLPASMLETLSSDSLRLLLRHELAHVKRRDLVWNLLLAVIGAVFFFHPFIWLALRRHRQTQESACDARVLASGDTEPASYGQLLVDVATNFTAGRPNPAVAGVVGSARTLKQRLSAMAHFRPAAARATVAIVLILSVTATVGLVPWRLVAREPVDVVGEILANWENQYRETKSLEYEVITENTRKPAEGEINEASPSARVHRRRTVELTQLGDRFGKTAFETDWTSDSQPQYAYHNTWVHDGTDSRNLQTVTRTDDDHVLTQMGNLLKADEPNRLVFGDPDLIALRFENDPGRTLKAMGYDLDQLKLVGEHVEFEGIECAELVTPLWLVLLNF